MTDSSKYRRTASIVAAVFLVFNVGLPIVIASCPMASNNSRQTPETQAAMCAFCPEQSGQTAEKLTSTKNTSCCTTLLAADKNTTEFVQANAVKHFSEIPTTSFLPAEVATHGRGTSLGFDVTASSSPPFCIDIPIFTSALLI